MHSKGRRINSSHSQARNQKAKREIRLTSMMVSLAWSACPKMVGAVQAVLIVEELLAFGLRVGRVASKGFRTDLTHSLT